MAAASSSASAQPRSSTAKALAPATTSASMTSRLLAGSVGGFVAESLTLPTDVIKVRLQLQQTASAGGTTIRYAGMWDCGRKIAATEGFFGLWKGYTPAILRQVSYSSLMMVLYEPVRNGLTAVTQIYGSQTAAVDVPLASTEKPSFLFRLMAGGIAGGVSIAIFNPFEVAKTRIQAQTTTKTAAESVAATRTVTSVFKEVLRVDGPRGLWSGVQPNVIRTFLVNAAELGTYDQAKTELFVPIFGDGLTSHVGASGIAGFASACVSTPADVVKTRLMNSAGVKEKQYSGMTDALVSIVKNEGVGALYKGFLPICVRKLIWVTAFFVSYERVRVLV
ncbi:unnamed protein product [Amoebophrya sp. A25]|nr:unnamed protein product [Amoebophrya sp. A25]|eukprot:GSA25T00005086001.1